MLRVQPTSARLPLKQNAAFSQKARFASQPAAPHAALSAQLSEMIAATRALFQSGATHRKAMIRDVVEPVMGNEGAMYAKVQLKHQTYEVYNDENSLGWVISDPKHDQRLILQNARLPFSHFSFATQPGADMQQTPQTPIEDPELKLKAWQLGRSLAPLLQGEMGYIRPSLAEYDASLQPGSQQIIQ